MRGVRKVAPLLLITFLIAQSASTAPMDGIAFDLAKLNPTPCSASNSDIVVCARNKPRDRMTALAELPEPQMPKAEFDLGDGLSAGASVASASVGGFQSNRLMMRLKKKF